MAEDIDAEHQKKCRRLGKFRQYLAATLVSLLGLSYGIATGWTSPMGALLTSDESPLPQKMDLYDIAWLGSISYAGSLICTFFWGILVDQLGRKVAAVLLAIPISLSWTLIIFATNLEWLILARVLQGIGNTGSIINVPIFISEIAQDDLRGFLGQFFTMAICIGVLFAYVVGTYFKYYALAISSLVVPCVFLLTFIWIPETPVYLWSRGEKERAKNSLFWYRGGDNVVTEQTLLKFNTIPEQKERPTLKALIGTKGTRKALVIGLALILAMQGSGLLTILSYAVQIFEMCGTSVTPYEAAIILGTINLISNIFSSLLVDRLGRKFILVRSQIIMAIALAVTGFYLIVFSDNPAESNFKWVPVLTLCIHVSAFSGGTGSVMYIITSEIFPPEIKGLAMGKLTLLSCVLSFTTINLFPETVDLIHLYGLFFSYSFFCILLAIFFCVYMPETKNVPQSVIISLLNGTANVKEEEKRLRSTENGKTAFYS